MTLMTNKLKASERNVMTFVTEKIPEAEKEKFNFPVRTSRNGNQPTLWKWVIDRDRDAYLVHTDSIGGEYDGTQKREDYAFVIEGIVVLLSAEMKTQGTLDVGQHLSWRIFNVRIPAPLKDKKVEIMTMIKEAFEAKEWPYKKKYFKSIDIRLTD